MKKANTIVIAGRANVGKSTLFNRIIEKSQALVSPQAGTTRDRTTGLALWRGEEYLVIDTGGLELMQKRPSDIDKEIVKQATKGLDEAGVVLFVVDVKDGLLPTDQAVAKVLRNIDKPVILVANKADGKVDEAVMADFVKLGFGEPYEVSAASGKGVGDLMDQAIEHVKPYKHKKTQKPPLRLAIIGQPNVGKSSIINTLLGEERVIVSAMAHTTRESHDINFIYDGRQFVLVDTAGIRRKKSARQKLEQQSVEQSITNAENADVIILVIDASQPIHSQDKRLGALLNEQRAGVMIVVNKWDLIPTGEKNPHTYKRTLYAHMPHITWAPIIFTSAKTKQRVRKIMEVAEEIQTRRKQQIANKKLELFLKKTLRKYKPRAGKGLKQPYIHHLRQIKNNPPLFEMAVNKYSAITPQYIRYIEKQIRQEFDFAGVPVRLDVVEYRDVVDKKEKK